MKRFAIGLIVVGVGLVGPLVASAATSSFSGTIDPSGTVSFKLHKHNGKLSIPGSTPPPRGFTFADLPVDCTGGAHTTGGVVTFKVPVNADTRKFHIKAVAGSPQNPNSSLDVKGTFNSKLTKASGTIRVHGTNVSIDGGGTDNCDSGTLDWSAKKT